MAGLVVVWFSGMKKNRNIHTSLSRPHANVWNGWLSLGMPQTLW
jgi:hypothetical protein